MYGINKLEYSSDYINLISKEDPVVPLTACLRNADREMGARKAPRLKPGLLGEGLEEESEHAVAGDVREGGEFEGVVAAGEFEGEGVGTVTAEGVQHLAGEFGEHGGVELTVDHESGATGTHAALDVGHGADWGPVFAELIDGDVAAEAFPDVVGGHALADNVSIVSGDVEKAAGMDALVVSEGDIADRGADAGAEDAKPAIALLLEPVEAAAGVLDGLAVGLEGEANIWAADLVGPLVAASHPAVVVGHAHFQHGDAEALNPAAETVLAVPFGIPVGEEEDSRACAEAFPTRASGDSLAGGKELGMDGIVFRPRRFDGTGEGQDVLRIEAVIGGGKCRVPFATRFDGVAGVVADECGGIGLVGRAAEVLEAPVKGLDAAIVVGGPAPMLVATNSAFEPVHGRNVQSAVYS
jgi:hypothetical protein